MTTGLETVGPCPVCGGTVWWVRVQDYLCARCHPDPSQPPPAETMWWPAFGWKKGTDLKGLKGVLYDDAS